MGTVNSHGFLRGYSEAGVSGKIRGRRFYCSNRGRRPGCGRIFSVLLRCFVARFTVTTKTLWRFLVAVRAGATIAVAWSRRRCIGARNSVEEGRRLVLKQDDIESFIKGQLDRVSLSHGTFTPKALGLIARSPEGALRAAKNLCIASLLEAVRDRTRTVDLRQVNRVLLQPHW